MQTICGNMSVSDIVKARQVRDARHLTESIMSRLAQYPEVVEENLTLKKRIAELEALQPYVELAKYRARIVELEAERDRLSDSETCLAQRLVELGACNDNLRAQLEQLLNK